MSFIEKDLSRRSFCQSVMAGSMALAFGRTNSVSAAEGIAPEAAFASSFRNVPDAYGPTRVTFDNTLPAGLRGTLFRNGPARMQRGDTRYNHWFDGDGMVHAFTLDEKGVTHAGRMVETERAREEEAAGRFLWSGFGTGFEDERSITRPDDVNVANISVLPVGDDVLALWEAGSPYRVHAETLETLGRHVFSAETDGLPFSAHPRVDPTGRIWNFGYLSGSGKLVLYDLNPSGTLHRTGLIDVPNADFVHDFAITDRHLVFVLLPMHFRPGGSTAKGFIGNLNWDADGAAHIVVVDKDTLEISKRFELPAFFAFHMGNAWQDGDMMHIEIATAPDFHPMMAEIEAATRGERLPATNGHSQAAEITLNMRTGTAIVDALPMSGVEFPRFDQRFTGHRTEQLFMLAQSDAKPDSVYGFNAVSAFDRRTDQETLFDYGAETLAEEHVFVPAPGGKNGQGWLIGTSYNWRSCRTTLSVFNAMAVSDGPIAQAELPYALPMGLHGQFVSA